MPRVGDVERHGRRRYHSQLRRAHDDDTGRSRGRHRRARGSSCFESKLSPLLPLIFATGPLGSYLYYNCMTTLPSGKQASKLLEHLLACYPEGLSVCIHDDAEFDALLTSIRGRVSAPTGRPTPPPPGGAFRTTEEIKGS